MNLDTTSKFRGASLVGIKFNRLTALNYAGKDKFNNAHWECVCDCGTKVVVNGAHLKSGNTKACGCLNLDGITRRRPKRDQIKEFWSRVQKFPSGCWEWTGNLSPQGYGMLYCNNEAVLAHRLSWFLHCGRWPTKPYVCHHCDNPKCVNPDHLFEGTALDNNRDCIAKGRASVKYGSPKLVPEQVIGIRMMYNSGFFSYRVLAKHLSLPVSTIQSALLKWKTLPLYATKR